MKLHLNSWQRIALTQIIGDVEGNVSILRKAAKILDVLDLNDEEKKLINYQVHEVGTITFENTHFFDLEISDSELIQFLQGELTNHNWPRGLFGNLEIRRWMFDLYEQVGVLNGR